MRTKNQTKLNKEQEQKTKTILQEAWRIRTNWEQSLQILNEN